MHRTRTSSLSEPEHAWTEMRQCKRLHYIEWHFDVTAQINGVNSPWWAQKGRPDCSSQQAKLRGAKSRHGLQVQQRKEVLRRDLYLQNPGFIVLSRVDGCRQPCDDARAKAPLDWAPKSEGHYDERTPAAPDCSEFWNVHGRRCDGGRRSGQEIMQGHYVLRSKALLPRAMHFLEVCIPPCLWCGRSAPNAMFYPGRPNCM